MKRLLGIVTLGMATLGMAALTGCGDGGTYKYNALGAPYELVVVADHPVWDGAAGDSLRAMFHTAFPMINRSETSFDLLRVLPSGFKGHISRHRNVLFATLDPVATEASLGLEQDMTARPQMVLHATAPTPEALTRLISERRDDIMLVLEKAEKDRDVTAARGHTPPEIAAAINEIFGFEMSVGPGYKVRNRGEDFLWLSYEMPASSQGIVIWSYPFSGVRDFELPQLLARRDEFARRIPAENPGSHMATNPELINLVYKTIDGRQWAEMSGFWDAVGDFMGGPYRNFSTLDAANQRVIGIDFYVYSPDPRFGQRNYIKQLEHFLYTVRISGEVPKW